MIQSGCIKGQYFHSKDSWPIIQKNMFSLLEVSLRCHFNKMDKIECIDFIVSLHVHFVCQNPDDVRLIISSALTFSAFETLCDLLVLRLFCFRGSDLLAVKNMFTQSDQFCLGPLMFLKAEGRSDTLLMSLYGLQL